MNFNGKHILVIGATSGIGKSIVGMLMGYGAKLTLTTRDLSKIPKEWNGLEIIQLDVNDEKSMHELVGSILAVDGVVYTPGIVKLFPTSYINQKQLDLVRKPLFDGAVLLLSKLLKAKRIANGASIVFVSSISSGFPYKGGAIYTSSKAALEAYSKVLALELAVKRIRSNCVKAGLVLTKILEETKDNLPEDVYKKHTDKYPLGIGSAEDVANAILFLLSEKSKWITGTEIILDGGLTAGA